MSTRKTLRLNLSAMKKIGTNPYNELELSRFIKKLTLPAYIVGRNIGIENVITDNLKGHHHDVFCSNPLLLGDFEISGIMNNGIILENKTIKHNNITFKSINVGYEILKWLWRPVEYIPNNIKIGSALTEYSSTNNIMVKVDNSVAFIQRQCCPEELSASISSIQYPTNKKSSRSTLQIDGQLDIFENTPSVLHLEQNYDYVIELIA
ncbi:MAG: hypothetical protein N2749_04285 [Clostridia bacterium]|nr:hypothetical protein [Clostridia bacterium]